MTALAPTRNCPVCADAIGEDAVGCPRCETPHHAECWNYVGDCAIFGCRETETTAVAAREDVAPPVVQSLSNQWAWIFRVQWWSFVAMATGLASLGLCGLFPIPGFWVLPMIFALGMMSLPLPVYVISVVPMAIWRGRLERALHTRLVPPPRSELRAVVDRLEMSPEHGFMTRFVNRLPYLYLGITAASMLWMIPLAIGFWGRVGMGMVTPLATLWAFGLAVTVGIRAATTARVAFVASVQNRLVSSAKARGQLPA